MIFVYASPLYFFNCSNLFLKILSYYFGRIINALYICTSSLEITYQERLRERPCEALATVSCGKRNGANSVAIKNRG
jgi:hypothetical protein